MEKEFSSKGKLRSSLPPRQTLLGQFIRYVVTGGLAFFVDFGLFALFLYGFGWHYLLANLMGLLGGLAINYYISIVWVFSACKRNVQNRAAEISIFSIIGFVGVGLNQLTMFLLVDFAELNEMLSKMVVAALIFMWNFGARKVILFRGKKIEEGSV